MSELLPVALAIGLLVTLAAAFLFAGDKWAARSPTEHGDFFAALHLIALVAAVIGSALAWMAFAPDHPRKWGHLLLPFVFVAIVYGYALRFDRTAWGHLLADIRARFRRKHAV